VIYLAHHNYFKPFRHRSDDQNTTHGEVAGVDRSLIETFKQSFFTQRAMDWRVHLETWQQQIWRRETQVPVHPVTPLARHLRSA
jgi:hypothetical protein